MGTIFAILSTFSLAYGYNLNNNTLGLLPVMEPGVFGWSLLHQDEQLYIGAPQAGAGQTGKVFQCQHLTTQPTCSPLNLEPEDGLEGSWFGGSLAASKDSLYSCAFRYSWADFDEGALGRNGKFKTGKCYKKGKGETSFEDLVDFTQVYEGREKYKFPRAKNRKYDMYVEGDKRYVWRDYGVYGASSTIDEWGNLVAGNPLELDGRGATKEPNNIFVGSIGKIEDLGGGKTKMIRPNRRTPWIVPNESEEEGDWTINRFAGYTVTSGKFFSGAQTGLAIGAPKIDNYRGKVYICKNCFQKSPTFHKLDGTKPGEHFGSSLAACDIDGDGREDLVVGAPNYAQSKQTYNSGLAYVIMVTGEFPRDAFDQPYSITAKPERKNGRFGSSVACLGDTDGRHSGRSKVMVGAPYYEERGAVFVFRYKLDPGTGQYKLQLSQTIKSQGWDFLMR